jgi:gluconokinase
VRRILLDRGNVFKVQTSEVPVRVVVMGVAGCGKTTLAQAWAARAGWHFVEGDTLHTPLARARMAGGQALDERHRRPWLRRLAQAMCEAPGPVVAAASLLRRSHRDLLRQAVPGLHILHLQLPQADALARCAARPGHFFPAALVASQYMTLETTDGEPGLAALDARLALPALLDGLRRALAQVPGRV